MWKSVFGCDIYLYRDKIYSYEHVDLENITCEPHPHDPPGSWQRSGIIVNGNWTCYGQWDEIENIRRLMRELYTCGERRVIECAKHHYPSPREMQNDSVRVARDYGVDFEGSLRRLTGATGFGRFEDDSIIVRISISKELDLNEYNAYISSKPAGLKSLVLRNWKEEEIKTGDVELLANMALKMLRELRETSAEIAKKKGAKTAGKKKRGAGNVPSHDLTPFGYKMTWLALRAENSAVVAAALKLDNPKPASWNDGIKFACDDFAAKGGPIFISPPINGWVLAIGFDERLDLHTPTPGHEYNTTILELSKKFGEAHYYGTHRVTEVHAWAKAVNGKMVRAYSWVGDQGEVFLDIGPLTKEEKKLGMKYDGEENVPDEENVLDIAAAWSVDPRLSNISSIPGEGLIGRIK